jgi:GlcNAc-P-P-Und epimerase
MRTLITGANGFLGHHLKKHFDRKYYHTLDLSNSDIDANLSNIPPKLSNSYVTVIHAAGKAHLVPHTVSEIQEFYDVNLGGTVNLCRALEENLPEKFIFISTVAVYGLENGDLVEEIQPLNGNSPYAKSKILAEDFLLEWGQKNNVQIIILRLPLLVGENPPGNLGAMIKAIRKGYYFRIGDGSTRRSMVLAEDVGNLIASNNLKPGIYNLTDGYHPSFKEIEDTIAKQLNRKIKSMPKLIVQTACKIGDTFSFFPINSYKYEKLTSSLTFSDQKARKELNWNPRSVIDGFKL